MPRVNPNANGNRNGEFITDAEILAERDPLPSGYYSGDLIYKHSGNVPAIWGEDDDVLWSKGEGLLVFAPDGCGKTTLTANLVRALLGTVDNVLGIPVRPIKDGERILLLWLDRPRQAARRYRQVLDNADPAIVRDKLVIRTSPEDTIDFSADPKTLRKMCNEVGAKYVIVDSLKDAVLGLEEPKAAAAWNKAVQLCIAAGIQVLVLHHPRKAQVGNAKPNKIDDLYSARWLFSGMGSIICLWGEPGDTVLEFIHIKQPANRCGPKAVMVMDRGLMAPCEGENAHVSTEELDRQERIIAALRDGAKRGLHGANKTALVKRIGGNRQAALASINALARQNRVVVTEVGACHMVNLSKEEAEEAVPVPTNSEPVPEPIGSRFPTIKEGTENQNRENTPSVPEPPSALTPAAGSGEVPSADLDQIAIGYIEAKKANTVASFLEGSGKTLPELIGYARDYRARHPEEEK